MNEKYLYRALRAEEIEAGNILIPKLQDLFRANPRLGIDTRLPFALGPTEEYAFRQHQWKQIGFPTRGISTTPHYKRAEFYASRNKVIVKIDRKLLNKYDIIEYIVKDWLGITSNDIAVPADDEVILVRNIDGDWPKEIISKIIAIT